MISHLNGGNLTRVVGDPGHGYTQGRLCAKGYALIQYALDEHRLKYPLLQVRRGSGEWRRISWEQAYERIADKILELNDRYASNLALGYFKGAGNTGFLHQAAAGMFAGLGPHSRPVGDSCSATGEAALAEVMGKLNHPDPEGMTAAGLIVAWGANPAVTNINQMKFIDQARRNGAPLVVIDPLFTHTAERADLYIQINPGTDAWLAWGIAKILIESHRFAELFLQQKTKEFKSYSRELNGIGLEEVCSQTGVALEVIEELAGLYARCYPVADWLGFGLQRKRYGGESVKAVSALAALTGSLTAPGGGVYFRDQPMEQFPQALAKHQGVKHPVLAADREISVHDYPRQALKFQEPPLKMLWISCGNPLAQDYNLQAWHELFQQLELIVTVDLYLSRTVRQSDLILPAASFLEEQDLHLSFWHHWLSLNQKVLPAYYEARSDLQIARELTRKLNGLRPGFSNFPEEKEPWQWIETELSEQIREVYTLADPVDLNKRSYKRRKTAPVPDWIYSFPRPQPWLFSRAESESECSPGSNFNTNSAARYPYYLLTPQSLLKFHTQYETLSWLNPVSGEEAVIELAEEIAHRHNIREDSLVEIYNENGVVRGRAKINTHLPPRIIITEQSDRYPVNVLLGGNALVRTDNADTHRDEKGGQAAAPASIPYFDCRINIRRVRNV